jgi:type III secretory pathway component EscU
MRQSREKRINSSRSLQEKKMKSIKLMLLGLLIAAFGLLFTQEVVLTYLFRNLTFLPADFFSNVLPLAGLIIVLIGIIIGLLGFFRRGA